MRSISKQHFLEFNLPSAAFWLVLAILFPLVGGNMLIDQALKTIVFFFAAIGTGFLILSPAKMLRELPPFLLTGLSWLVGGTAIFILIGLFSSNAAVYIIAVLSIPFLLLFTRLSIRFDKLGFAAVLPCILFLFNRKELHLALSETFINPGGDYFYFEAIVVSLSKTLSIFDAIFHKGVPINYSSLPFFTPAALSHFTGISGHIAYSGMYVPVLKVLSFSVAAAAAVKIAWYFYPDIRLSWRLFLGASISLILLAPLHPLYLVRLDIKHFIFLGEGYLLPMGNMGFAFSIILFAAAIYYFFDLGQKTFGDFLSFIVLVASTAAAKPALFLPVVAFYGLLSFYRLMIDRNFFPLAGTVLGFVAGIGLSKIFTGNDGGMMQLRLTSNNGYFLHYLTTNAPEFYLPASVTGAVSLFLFMVFIWLGLKILIFGTAWVFEQKIRPYIIITLLTIAAAALPGWFLNMLYYDEAGKLLQDASFDTAQFLRGGLFISTFIATACLIVASYRLAKKKFLWGAIIAWFTATLICLISTLNNATPVVTSVWETQVTREFRVVRPKLMAMLSSNDFSGQVLAANEIGPWWICCERTSAGGAYLCTLIPNYRNILLKNLLSDRESSERKVQILSQMTQEGVDVIVATPAYLNQLENLVQEGLLIHDARYKWFYYLSGKSSL